MKILELCVNLLFILKVVFYLIKILWLLIDNDVL